MLMLLTKKRLIKLLEAEREIGKMEMVTALKNCTLHLQDLKIDGNLILYETSYFYGNVTCHDLILENPVIKSSLLPKLKEKFFNAVIKRSKNG